MNFSDAPSQIQAAFANAGIRTNIPIFSTGAQYANSASYQSGFPPITMTPYDSGGQPPLGADVNGILYAMSSVIRWVNAGGVYQYNSAFSTAVGGYPRGALLQKATGQGWWQSTIDNNTSNPDSGGANWVDPVASILINAALSGVPTTPTPSVGDSSNKVPSTQFVANNVVGGVGRTWKDVTSFRSIGTIFTSPAYPIEVNVRMESTASNASPFITINGIQVEGTGQGTAGLGMAVIAVIPPNTTYSVNLTAGVAQNWRWMELS